MNTLDEHLTYNHPTNEFPPPPPKLLYAASLSFLEQFIGKAKGNCGVYNSQYCPLIQETSLPGSYLHSEVAAIGQYCILVV